MSKSVVYYSYTYYMYDVNASFDAINAIWYAHNVPRET